MVGKRKKERKKERHREQREGYRNSPDNWPQSNWFVFREKHPSKGPSVEPFGYLGKHTEKGCSWDGPFNRLNVKLEIRVLFKAAECFPKGQCTDHINRKVLRPACEVHWPEFRCSGKVLVLNKLDEGNYSVVYACFYRVIFLAEVLKLSSSLMVSINIVLDISEILLLGGILGMLCGSFVLGERGK